MASANRSARDRRLLHRSGSGCPARSAIQETNPSAIMADRPQTYQYHVATVLLEYMVSVTARSDRLEHPGQAFSPRRSGFLGTLASH
jgi:hypothetical protein